MRTFLKKTIFFIIIVLMLTTCGQIKKTCVLKLAHGLDVTHPVHLGMVTMADQLKEKSGGRMRIDIYPGGQLGQERELIELLQIGSLAMTKVSTAPLESFVPEMKIFGIPYLFRDDQHRWKVLEGEIGRKLLLAGEHVFLRGMCYYDAGSRSFYTKDRPIGSPKDLKGLKIRVMKSITAVQMVQALGGSATPISWGELYTSLQQGVVDGAENNPPSFYLSHHYDVCKFYCLDEHTAPPDILLMSTIVWNRLSPQEKQWLREAVGESVNYQRQLWNNACKEALEAVQLGGVRVIVPDKEPFVQAVQSMYEQYRNTSIYALIKEIQAIQ
jgi:tripartite ATP-independent transporter DctP family solute receptor